jgi:hypothetical protein
MWPLAHGVLLGKDVAAVTGGGGPRADFGHEPPLLYVRHPLDHVRQGGSGGAEIWDVGVPLHEMLSEPGVLYKR